jgi:hypothetical protein
MEAMSETMSNARWSGVGLVLMAALLHAAGCKPGVGSLTPVTGRVTYKGAAVQSGAIVFTPDAKRGETGRIAFGKLAPDGSYALATGDTPGAAPGWYRVTVLSHSGETAVGNLRTPQSFLPEKYRDPDQSQLGCEVKANRPNAIDFNLD